MISIDHVALGSRNLYEAADRLRKETGFGFYDGGWFKAGLANKIFPLGKGTYLEVESIIDPSAMPQEILKVFGSKMESGDRFTGLCLRVDSYEELQELAKRHKTVIPDAPGLERIRTNGPSMVAYQTPIATETWPKGLPNWYYFTDMTIHPSGQPPLPEPGLVEPLGISWLEMGGTEAQMTEWLGVPASGFPFRFNGKALGLYAVAVNTKAGEVEIRRRAVNEV